MKKYLPLQSISRKFQVSQSFSWL